MPRNLADDPTKVSHPFGVVLVVVKKLAEEIRRVVGFDEMIRSDFVGHC